MALRRDAFAGAAEAAAVLERLALESPSGSTVGTIGVVQVSPGAINVIPGEVELHVDIRDYDSEARVAVVEGFLSALDEIGARRGLEIAVETITTDQPAVCSPVVVEAVRARAPTWASRTSTSSAARTTTRWCSAPRSRWA